jgi:hypothetical protein
MVPRPARAALLATLAWAAACAAVTACGPRPLPGTRGCSRQVDCLGSERCDPATKQCVPEGSVDAGPCAGTYPGCTDDALNNRAPECATVVAQGGTSYGGLLMCPTTTDHFSIPAQAGWGLEVLAWPSTPVDLTLTIRDGQGSVTAQDGNASNALALVTQAGLTQDVFGLEVTSGGANATYDLLVRAGESCQEDGDCGSGRCDILMPNPFNTGVVPTAELDRGGVCVSNAASPCGDARAEGNTRGDGTVVANGTGFLLGTCLRDVDYGRFDMPGSAKDVNIRLTCNNPDQVFFPHIMVLGFAGALEYAALLTDNVAGTPTTRTVRALAPGAHQVRVTQLAGPSAGSCNVVVAWVDGTCTANSDCTGDPGANAFGRVRCVGGACVR